MAVGRPAKGSQEETSGLPGDDRLLVEAAKKDPGRFAELYELNFTRVYAYIARRVGDRDVAQDLPQMFPTKPWRVFRVSNGAACPSPAGCCGLRQT